MWFNLEISLFAVQEYIEIIREIYFRGSSGVNDLLIITILRKRFYNGSAGA